MQLGKAQPVNVLVVDDDEIDRIAVQRAFRRHQLSHPLYFAKDGVEALSVLRGTDGRAPLPSPRVVLLDLNLPRMNGFEFLDAVREDPALKSLVVFVLSTSQNDVDVADAYARQVAGYLAKGNLGDGMSGLVELLGRYSSAVTLEAGGPVGIG